MAHYSSHGLSFLQGRRMPMTCNTLYENGKCCWNSEDKGIWGRDAGWKLLNLNMPWQKGQNLDQQKNLGTKTCHRKGMVKVKGLMSRYSQNKTGTINVPVSCVSDGKWLNKGVELIRSPCIPWKRHLFWKTMRFLRCEAYNFLAMSPFRNHKLTVSSGLWNPA